MSHKGRILIFVVSVVLVLYGASAMFFGKEAYKELAVFMDVLQRVRDDYVEEPRMDKVQEGAMYGLLAALDADSSFMSRDLYTELEKRREMGAAGAGMVVSKRSDVVYVVAMEADGVADKAGVRPGDYLISINGEDVEVKSLLEVNSLLHGAVGTRVKLTLFRGSQTKPKEVELVLQEPEPVRITSRMLDGNIGYVRIPTLNAAAVNEARVKLKTLISAGIEKIVLDLRDCADGDYQSAADVANFFLKDEVLYFSRGRDGDKYDVVEAVPEKFLTNLPMVLLLNGSTSGPAEIVAGALKDNRRAKLVGEKSFGVGAAQKTMHLKSGAVLILSVAKYCTPDGKAIQDETARKAGIEPDFESPDSEKRQDLAVESYYDFEENDDGKYRVIRDKIDQIQLDKAIEVLSGATPAEAKSLQKAA